jgi:hypothetical protein
VVNFDARFRLYAHHYLKDQRKKFKYYSQKGSPSFSTQSKGFAPLTVWSENSLGGVGTPVRISAKDRTCRFDRGHRNGSLRRTGDRQRHELEPPLCGIRGPSNQEFDFDH